MTDESRSDRAYRRLLALYPRDFHDRFGADMAAVFRDQRRAVTTRQALLRLWVRAAGGLLRTAALEHLDALKKRGAGPPFRPRRRPMFRNLIDDVRYTGRMLRKSPVFTAVAVLVIALGTGAVTTIFSAANAIALRPLPGAKDPGSLVEVRRSQANGAGSLSASYPYYRRMQGGTRTLKGLVAWDMVRLTIATGVEGQAALGNIVSGNYFDVLGVRPALGRFFGPDEATTTELHPVVIVAHAFWTRRLGADSSIIGRPITLNGHPFTIIGVAPPAFRGVFTPLRTDAWVPISAQPLLRPGGNLDDAGAGWLELFGRLGDGVTRGAARAELTSLTAAQIADGGETGEFRNFSAARVEPLTGLPSDVHGAVLGFMGLLLAAAGLVLLIASVNIAAMLLARGVSRRREMALRAALGAERSRLATQLLTETLLLFMVGGAGGVLLTTQATRLIERLPLPFDMPIVLDLSPDPRVLIFALTLSLVTGLSFGLGPALEGSRVDLAARIGSDTAGAGSRRSRARSALVVGQMALSLLLLVAAGLFIRALDRGRSVDPGFDPSNVAVASFDLQSAGYDEPRGRIFYRELAERLSREAGVVSIAYTRFLPLSMSVMATGIRVDGYGPRAGEESSGVTVADAQVDPGYFNAVRIPLVRGRAFLPTDDDRAPRVAIVNRTFAERYWPGQNAVGRTFHEREDQVTIVGEVRDAKYETLNEDPTPFVYFPVAQQWSHNANLLVRTAADPAGIAAAIRRAVRTLDPSLPAPTMTTLKEATSIVLLPQRVAAYVTAVLGLVGLVLAALGLYGVIAYSVSQRTREIGVRMALGASRTDVLRLVVREGMRLVAVGMAIGLALSLGATRLLSRFLFNVSPVDGVTFVAVPVLLGGVALAASYLPARRAALQDPTRTLRYDG